MIDTAKVLVGGQTVVTSSSVVSLDGQPVEIRLRPVINNPLSVQFNFEDREGASQKLESKTEGNLIKIILINFTNPIGTANISPINIGHINNRAIYLSFVVYFVGIAPTSARLINYTFTASGEDDV